MKTLKAHLLIATFGGVIAIAMFAAPTYASNLPSNVVSIDYQ